ncbi:MAG: ribonuclease Z [Mycoplasmatota bacterium]
MKINVIGSGTMDSSERNNSSFLLDDILIDCGMGTIKSFERQNNKVKDIKYVLITHYHADHFFDLPNLIIARKGRKETNEILYIIGPSDIKEKTEQLMYFSFNKNYSLKEYANIEFIALEDKETFKFNTFDIQSYNLLHGTCNPNNGYMIKKQNKVISFTGDTTLCENLYQMCEKSDIIFIDATKKEETTKGHLSYSAIKDLSKKYNNCIFYPVHRSDYEIESTDNIIILNDGDNLEI